MTGQLRMWPPLQQDLVQLLHLSRLTSRAAQRMRGMMVVSRLPLQQYVCRAPVAVAAAAAAAIACIVGVAVAVAVRVAATVAATLAVVIAVMIAAIAAAMDLVLAVLLPLGILMAAVANALTTHSSFTRKLTIDSDLPSLR